MALRGCISVRALPLQILLRENPSWVGTPVAVTKEERPQSPIIALNREAREKGLAAGMRYASALSLVPALRARAVPADKIFEARESIARFLSAFTPDIEPCPFDVDAFWVSVDGLRSLFASEARWIKSVEDALAAQGFRVNVVVGFTRFGTYAIARSRSRSRVFASPTDEQALMSRSPVDILPLSQRTKSTLRKLEVRTVQQFVSLPAGRDRPALRKRRGIPSRRHPLGRPASHSARFFEGVDAVQATSGCPSGGSEPAHASRGGAPGRRGRARRGGKIGHFGAHPHPPHGGRRCLHGRHPPGRPHTQAPSPATPHPPAPVGPTIPIRRGRHRDPLRLRAAVSQTGGALCRQRPGPAGGRAGICCHPRQIWQRFRDQRTASATPISRKGLSPGRRFRGPSYPRGARREPGASRR